MTTEACCTPAPPAAETSQGREDTLGGLRVYLSGSASATAAVILIPDIFGKQSLHPFKLRISGLQF